MVFQSLNLFKRRVILVNIPSLENILNNEFETLENLTNIVNEFLSEINNEVSQATNKIPNQLYEKEKEHLLPLSNESIMKSYLEKPIFRKVLVR